MLANLTQLPPYWATNIAEITEALQNAIRLNDDLEEGRTDDILAWLKERQRAEHIAYAWVDRLSITDVYEDICRALNVIMNASSGSPERIPAALLLLQAFDAYIRAMVAAPRADQEGC